MDIQSAIDTMQNLIRETEFEGDFVSLKVSGSKCGTVLVETETADFPKHAIFDKKDFTVRRRFIMSGNTVDVEVWDDSERKWISEAEATWLHETTN